MTATLTIPAIIREVKRLAREQPERITRCEYVRFVGAKKTPTCECIVGTALNNLGVPISTLRKYNKAGVVEMLSVIFDDEIDWEAHADDLTWLEDAQNNQDAGGTWQQAVRMANRQQRRRRQLVPA